MKTDRNKVEIILEDGTNILIDKMQYYSSNLYNLDEINDVDLLNIKLLTLYNEAKSKALRFISLRLKTKYEIINKLAEQGYEKDVYLKVCEELENEGYINDYEYCIKYISHSKKLKNMSDKMIISHLKNKGIDESLVYEAIKKSNINDLDTAVNLLLKKYKKNSIKDIDNRKAIVYLTNKGFSYECSKKALEKYLTGFE